MHQLSAVVQHVEARLTRCQSETREISRCIRPQFTRFRLTVAFSIIMQQMRFSLPQITFKRAPAQWCTTHMRCLVVYTRKSMAFLLYLPISMNHVVSFNFAYPETFSLFANIHVPYLVRIHMHIHGISTYLTHVHAPCSNRWFCTLYSGGTRAPISCTHV